MTEQAALLAAIAAEPGDDVRRLGYADWLDENNQPDRAEFIRVQVELAIRFPGHNSNPSMCQEEWHLFFKGACGGCQRLARAAELLDRHRAEWSRIPCPGCGGCGEMVFAEMPRVRPIIEIIEGNVPDISLPRTRRGPCPTCGGSGNLFSGRTVTFARGFPESVFCTLGEVVRPDGKATEWARAVVKAAPVVKFAVTGVELYRSPSGAWTFPQTSLRSSLLKKVEGNHRSESAATEALAVALGQLVRADVYGKAVPT